MSSETDDMECNKYLVGRGPVATPGVEGFCTLDGVVGGHVFSVIGESAVDAIDGFLNMEVSTSTPCSLQGCFGVCSICFINSVGSVCFSVLCFICCSVTTD